VTAHAAIRAHGTCVIPPPVGRTLLAFGRIGSASVAAAWASTFLEVASENLRHFLTGSP